MIKKACILLVLVLSLGNTTFAQDEKKEAPPAPPSFGAVVLHDNVQVFPAHEFGNTLYLNKSPIISRKDLILKDIVEAPGGFVYYGITKSDQVEMGYTGADQTAFTPLEGGFYQLKADGKSKIFRVDPDGLLQDLLPNSGTASGLVYNGAGFAAFFHISSGEPVEVGGKQKYQYSFRLHVVKNNSARVRHLAPVIKAYEPTVELKWVKKNTLQYPVGEGAVELFVVK